ncbi:MAG: ATP-binding protein [Fusobacteriota bacterium]
MNSKETIFETTFFICLVGLIGYGEYFAKNSAAFVFVLILLLETMGILIYSYRKFRLFKESDYTYFLMTYGLFGIILAKILYEISNNLIFGYNYFYMIKLIDVAIIIFAVLIFRKQKNKMYKMILFILTNIALYVLAYMTQTGMLLLLFIYLELYFVLNKLEVDIIGNKFFRRSIKFKIIAELCIILNIVSDNNLLVTMGKIIYIYSFYVFIKYLENTIDNRYSSQMMRKEKNFENILQEFDYGVIKLLDYRVKEINEKALNMLTGLKKKYILNKNIEEISEDLSVEKIDELVKTGNQKRILCEDQCIGLNAYLVNDVESSYIVLVLKELVSAGTFYKINEKYEDIIYLYEKENGYRFVNSAIKEVLGYTKEEFYNNPEIRKDIEQNEGLNELLDTKDKIIKTQNSNGDIVWLLKKEVEVKIKERTYKYIIATDVTNFKEKEKDLEIKIAGLEKDKQREGRTISVVSHEMRTPITSMVGFIESILLNSENIDEKYIKYMEKIYKNSMRLKALIDNVLNFNKLLEGKLEVDRESVNLNKIIDEIILNNKILSGLRNIETINNIDKKLYIEIDELMLYQIINNITSNAIKYNWDDGQVVFDYEEKEESIILKISDTGIGIKKEDRDKIFKEYERIKGTNEKGTGLGLALTKRMMEMNNGKIWFTSEYKKGTTMYLEFEKAVEEL